MRITNKRKRKKERKKEEEEKRESSAVVSRGLSNVPIEISFALLGAQVSVGLLFLGARDRALASDVQIVLARGQVVDGHIATALGDIEVRQ